MTTMEAPAPTAWRARWLVCHGYLRLALLVSVLVVAATVPVVSSRTASLAELQGAIEAGRVGQVSVSGALPSGATGSRTADLVWQDGPNARVTTVLHLSDGSQAPPPGLANLDQVVGDLRHQLESWDGRATLRVVDGADLAAHGTSIAGWQLPAWLGQVAQWLWAAAVLVLTTGPEPRWATRWAWFWAFISPLAVWAVPLFAVASVPLPGRPSPRRPHRQLTGGWAFLLVLIPGFGR